MTLAPNETTLCSGPISRMGSFSIVLHLKSDAPRDHKITQSELGYMIRTLELYQNFLLEDEAQP